MTILIIIIIIIILIISRSIIIMPRLVALGDHDVVLPVLVVERDLGRRMRYSTFIVIIMLIIICIIVSMIIISSSSIDSSINNSINNKTKKIEQDHAVLAHALRHDDHDLPLQLALLLRSNKQRDPDPKDDS